MASPDDPTVDVCIDVTEAPGPSFGFFRGVLLATPLALLLWAIIILGIVLWWR